MNDFNYLPALVFLIAVVGYKLLRRRREAHSSRTVLSKSVSTHDTFVKLQTVPDLGTAYVLKGFLEVNGVPSLIRGESRYAEAIVVKQGIDLLVSELHLAEARSLIEDVNREQQD